ncbi:FabD/lysophospholipase-like protein [Westerdykella ornata]|uniref:FabD/lysophospholipase-like protein n=1 Tax=Westerdykella ornata TaxID=318751 RepID=A0A6A6K245_WESOR|nr:FabD/lysophospholipase-like protein [Westerdykella ornata]KAF2281459.1 FabD/lysophospholipase-like protein [Westerdykella ornata]
MSGASLPGPSEAVPQGVHRSQTGESFIFANGNSAHWRERNLLSLDGGGIRGYWSLLVLERLMAAIAREEREHTAAGQRSDSFWPATRPRNVVHTWRSSSETEDEEVESQTPIFLPCHYFDIICGSSTGRFRMTVQDCLYEYERMSNHIFGKPRWVSQRNIGIVRWPKYSSKAMERAFTDVTRRRGETPVRGQLTHTPPYFPTIPGTCAMYVLLPILSHLQLFVTTNRRIKSASAARPGVQRLYLIRSYDHKTKPGTPNTEINNFGKAEQMEIWQVARAATAAPMYFREIKFTPPHSRDRYYFSDGGFGHTNNPTEVGIQEIQLRFGAESVGAVVSIGTARADDDNSGGRSIFKRVHNAFSIATNPRIVANQVRRRNLPHYWRLNDEEGLRMELDDWQPNGLTTSKENRGRKTLQEIRARFNEWALVYENDESIRACARELVRRRRARIQDGARWEVYATGASNFRCRHEHCPETPFPTRDHFREHWHQCHEDNHEDADRCREPEFTIWRYRNDT